jgi:hypothetical protein
MADILFEEEILIFGISLGILLEALVGRKHVVSAANGVIASIRL